MFLYVCDSSSYIFIAVQYSIASIYLVFTITFYYSHFQNTEKLTELFGYLYSYHLDSTVNIFAIFVFTHRHPSISPSSFLMHFKISCQIVFQSGFTKLHAYQQCVRVLFALHPYQHLILLVLF